MKKIAIIGSCVSRLAFRKDFVPANKSFFKIVNYQFHTSIISLMSPNIHFNRNNIIGKEEALYRDHLLSELEKDGLNDLLANNPDYIILDFYPDVFFGVFKVQQSYMTNKTFRYKKFKVFEDLDISGELNLINHFNDYFNLWTTKLHDFIEFSKTNLPNTKILVTQARFTTDYFNPVTQAIEKIKTSHNLELLNEIWNKLDKYAIEVYGLTPIQLNDKHYFADPFHIHELDPLHYKNNYYVDFFHKLLYVVFNDLDTSKKTTSTSFTPNLVRNPDFRNNNEFWTHIDKNFTTKNGKLIFDIHHFDKNMHSQVTSNAIEINGNGERTFKLTFKCTIDNLEELEENDRIFLIRTFNDKTKLWSKDAIENYYLSANDFNIKPNRITSVEFYFKPKGRYIKIAPYMVRNGKIQWSDIKLTVKG